jgi:hypothetical protein
MLIDTSLEKLNSSGAGSTRYHFCYNKKRKENIIIKYLKMPLIYINFSKARIN